MVTIDDSYYWHELSCYGRRRYDGLCLGLLVRHGHGHDLCRQYVALHILLFRLGYGFRPVSSPCSEPIFCSWERRKIKIKNGWRKG